MHCLTELLVNPKHVLGFFKMARKKKVQTMFLHFGFYIGGDQGSGTWQFAWLSVLPLPSWAQMDLGCFIRPQESKGHSFLPWFTLVWVAWLCPGCTGHFHASSAVIATVVAWAVDMVYSPCTTKATALHRGECGSSAGAVQCSPVEFCAYDSRQMF